MLIYKNTDWENSMQSDHDYKVDERVLIRDNQVNKYETPYRLPYPIIFLLPMVW